MMICAHRGGSLEVPENTLGGFIRARDQGIRAFECDVHLAADGQLVVIHDDKTDRTTGTPGLIAQLSAEALGRYNAAACFDSWPDHEGVPTARAVFEALRDAELFFIEVKKHASLADYAAVCEQLEALIRESGMGDRVVTESFDVDWLKVARERMPRQPRALIVSQNDHAIDLAVKHGCGWLSPQAKHWSEALTRQAHDAGLQIDCWTPNTEEEMYRVAGYGVDALVTDRPCFAQTLDFTRAPQQVIG